MKRLVVIAALAACGGEGEPDDVCVIDGDGPGFDLDGEMCERLSSYRLFADLAAQEADPALFRYDLNTALFSDYTAKDRYLFVPEGETIAWQDDASFQLPVGSIIVKTFSYPADLRDPDGPRDLLETRLMLRTADGWDAAAYLYDDDDQEAHLAVAGDTVPASWIHTDGEPRQNDYAVPNKNQCKNCHEEVEDEFGAIGPKARHVNRDGQLEAMIEAGVLTGAPDPSAWPVAPAFDDPEAGTVEERARAWLDINCAHCHNPQGMARTSGLDLRVDQLEPVEYGVCKPPVAAGGGSGGLPFGILPGDPDRSILVYRIESTDPDVKMPELGRNLVHEEGAALVREWIAAMKGSCPE